MKYFKLLLVVIMACILSGCYTTRLFRPKPHIYKTCQSVESHKIITAGAGEVIFREYACSTTTGSVAIIKKKGQSLTLIECDDLKFDGTLNSSCKTFCDKESLFSMYSINWRTQPSNCFQDRNNDGLFELGFGALLYSEGNCRAEGFLVGDYRTMYHTYLDKPIPYLALKTTHNNKDFELRLIYQGMSGNVLNIEYREFSDWRIKPVFLQDLKFTLNSKGSTEITFKSVRIKVYSADNQSIRYEILSDDNN